MKTLLVPMRAARALTAGTLALGALSATAAAAQGTAPAATPPTVSAAPSAPAAPTPPPKGAEPAAPAVMTSTYGAGSATAASRTGSGSRPNGGAAAADPATTARDIVSDGKRPR